MTVRFLLIFFAESVLFFQSLRPNIHTSVGTRWVNSKAAVGTTPSIPQQHDCLLNSLRALAPGRRRGRSLSQSIAVNLRGSIKSRVRGSFRTGSPDVSVFVFYMLPVLQAHVALTQTCVNIQLLSGCPAERQGGGSVAEVTGA